MLGQYSAQLNGHGRWNASGRAGQHAEVLVHMEQVSVSYDDERVLKDISWTLREGERWALLGANGAGKTTLMSLIVADNPQAYANRIELFGVQRGSGESIWQIKQRIGWVSPELHIFYHKQVTAFDVVCSGFFSSNGLHRSCSAAQQNLVHDWMRALEIYDLQKTPFNRLSSGQQRMVILARSLVNFAPLLVLDEPCQALDDHYQQRLIRFIERLCSVTPVAMIYVTHVRDEMPSSITHFMLLEQGEVVRQGAMSEEDSSINGRQI